MIVMCLNLSMCADVSSFRRSTIDVCCNLSKMMLLDMVISIMSNKVWLIVSDDRQVFIVPRCRPDGEVSFRSCAFLKNVLNSSNDNSILC